MLVVAMEKVSIYRYQKLNDNVENIKFFYL